MYTVHSDYFATGEGVTYMVLFTQAFGEHDSFEGNALEDFKSVFGDYYAIGAEVKKGLFFDFNGAEYLITDKLKERLLEYQNKGLISYHASYHMNLS